MAKQFLNFFKGKSAPSAAVVGSVWFDSEKKLIKVKVAESGDNAWESYSGLQDVTWNETDKKLVFTKPDGTTFGLTLSDVASKTVLEALAETVATNKSAAETGISEAKADAAAVSTALTEYKTANDAAVKALQDQDGVIAGQITALQGEDTTIKERLDEVETKASDNAAAITALQNAVGTGGAVETAINNAITAYDTDTVQPGLASKADKDTYDAYVEANDAAVDVIRQALAAEVTRSTTKDGEIEGALTAHVNNTDVHIQAGERARWTDAAESIEAFMKLEDGETLEQTKDTLIELQKYIADHGTEAAGMLEDISKNKTAIADLQAADTAMDGRVTTLEEGLEECERVTAESHTNLNERLTVVEGKVDVTKVSTAISEAVTPVSTKVNTLETTVANNHSAALEAAADAEQNAKDYADNLVMDGETPRFDANGAAAAAQAAAEAKAAELDEALAATLRGEISTAKTEAINTANAYADGLWMWQDFE